MRWSLSIASNQMTGEMAQWKAHKQNYSPVKMTLQCDSPCAHSKAAWCSRGCRLESTTRNFRTVLASILVWWSLNLSRTHKRVEIGRGLCTVCADAIIPDFRTSVCPTSPILQLDFCGISPSPIIRNDVYLRPEVTKLSALCMT